MPILKLSNQFLGRLAAHLNRLRYTDVPSYSTISREMERVYVPGTVSGRLRSSAPHMRSVRMNDMIRQRQRHLRDGFLKAQGTSTIAIMNPECPIVVIN